MRTVKFTYWHPHATAPEPEESELVDFFFRALGSETLILMGFFPPRGYLNRLLLRGHDDKQAYEWEPFQISDDELELLFEATRRKLSSIGKSLAVRNVPDWVNRSEVLMAVYLDVPETEVREFHDRLEVLQEQRTAALKDNNPNLADEVEFREDFEIEQLVITKLVPRKK